MARVPWWSAVGLGICLWWASVPAAPAHAQEPDAVQDASTDDSSAEADTPAADAQESDSAAAEAEAASEAEMDVADAEAREHFRIGKTFYEAGRFEEAGQEFEKAYALSNRSPLLYNVYVAFRDASDFPKAIDALERYLAEVPDAPDRINLKARLASMKKAQAERDAQAEASQELPAQASSETRTEVKRSVVPLVLMAAGGALVTTSAVTGGLTLARTSDLDEKCGGTSCDPEFDGDVTRAHSLAVSTDVLLFTGLATAATGLVLYLTGALDTEREVPVAAGCGPGGCGVSFHGRF